MANLSKAKATAALNAVKRAYKAYLDEGVEPPVLVMGWTESGAPAICWESGPYDWAMLTDGGIEEEFGFTLPAVKWPKGVYAEAYNGCVKALYPA